ncbi:MAG: hypothetical protein ABI609_10830 [Acidobacteriota bacterium]
MDSMFATAGEWLGNLYLGYGLFFLTGGSLFCVHLSVLVFLLWRRDPRRFSKTVRWIEVFYGLINPLIYLLFAQSTFTLQRSSVLTSIGWTVWLSVWVVRLWGGLARTPQPLVARRVARLVLAASLLCVAAFFIKDAVAFRAYPSVPKFVSMAWWLGLSSLCNMAALYAIPAVLLLRLLRLATKDSWGEGEAFFVLSPRLAMTSGPIVVLTLVLWYLPTPTSSVERRVLADRPVIREASERHQLDPRLLASILYVIERDHSTTLARQLERTAMGAWLTDTTDHVGLTETLDLSIGIAQIRPLTALTALVIYDAAKRRTKSVDDLPVDQTEWSLPPGSSYKEFRGVPALDGHWRLPASAVATLRPTFIGLPSKESIVHELFDDAQNLEMCGLILALYAAQWQTTNPAWDIHDRPEILATLYQLGFERSRPKADPRPIPFGVRVREVYESNWMRANFAPQHVLDER